MQKMLLQKYFCIILLSWTLRTRANNVTAQTLSTTTETQLLANKLPKFSNNKLLQVLKRIIFKLNSMENGVEIVAGVKILPELNKQKHHNLHEEQSANIDFHTLSSYFIEYVRTHTLQINFFDIFTEAFSVKSNYLGEARKKDKGQGLLLAMSVMFAKMMALLGIGGIALLALKALGVATTALLVSGLIGLKTLSQQGNESAHSVQYLASA